MSESKEVSIKTVITEYKKLPVSEKKYVIGYMQGIVSEKERQEERGKQKKMKA